jgi:hypothetical protein
MDPVPAEWIPVVWGRGSSGGHLEGNELLARIVASNSELRFMLLEQTFQNQIITKDRWAISPAHTIWASGTKLRNTV